jgi:hypothetical protein
MSRSRKTVVIVMGLLAALSAVACGGRSLPEGVDLVPADATFAISLDVPAIMSSELYEALESSDGLFGRNRMNFYRFAEAAGLDPRTDIRRLIFLMRAGKKGVEDMSAIVTGSFDGKKVHDYLTDSGLPVHQVSGTDIFEFIMINDECRFCMAVIDEHTAAFGDGQTLAKIAKVHEGSMPALSSDGTIGRLLSRLGRDPDVWAVLMTSDISGALADLMSRVSADAGGLKGLGPVRGAAFSFNATDPMRVLIELAADSEEDAMLVADILKGGEALGRLALRESRPELARIMSDLAIEADTELIRITGSVPSADIQTVTRLLGKSLMEGVSPLLGQTEKPAP